MELAEELVAIKAEKEHLLKTIRVLEVEKTALDESYVATLREKLAYHKELIITKGQLAEEREKIKLLEARTQELSEK